MGKLRQVDESDLLCFVLKKYFARCVLTCDLVNRVERHPHHPVLVPAAPIQIDKCPITAARQRRLQVVIWLDVCLGRLRRVLVQPISPRGTCCCMSS